MDLNQELVARADEILGRGLCSGVGKADGQMCIESAISVLAGEEFGDEPVCVASAVRGFCIKLNDAGWSSAEARAAGMRSLLLSQLGSAGVVDSAAFSKRVAELTIRRLIPARDAADAAADAADAAADAADAAYAAAAAAAAARAARAARAAGDKYLRLSATIAVDVLRELSSPGCALLEVPCTTE